MAAKKSPRRTGSRMHLVPTVAVYACGHRVELAPRGDADVECVCSRHAPLMGLVARAA